MSIAVAKPVSISLEDERVLPDTPDQGTFSHHLARYHFAVSHLRGHESILDAGCGAGYGTFMLSERAQSACGIDYSPHALGYAREHYRRPNLSFAQMDCLHLAFPDATFDLITSFEVFEHMTDPAAYLGEFLRVLRPGGRLILSTPNRVTTDIHMRSVGLHNEFHVNMVDAAEFQAILSCHFPSVSLYAQRRRGSTVYSLLRSLDVFNLRLRWMGNSRRQKVQKALGVQSITAASPEQWVFSRSQLRQSNMLVAVCTAP